MSDTSERVVEQTSGSYGATSVALVVVFIIYVALLLCGLPQKWTNAQFHNHSHEETAIEKVDEDSNKIARDFQKDAAEGEIQCPPLWTSIPFVVLLLCIALLPLIPATEHWWESNLHRFYVAAFLALLALGYYAFFYRYSLDLHWPAHRVVDADSGWFAKASTVFVNAILGEYVSFIVLLFSLFSITGGIRIVGDLKASPANNSLILAIGAALASFVGTTGAAMLLIRLLLETNKFRKHKIHTIVFFIFCVCNVGGCLLPIGDPPLFLGYLRGVRFLWTFHLWKEWLFVCGLLIALYYLLDKFYFYARETTLDQVTDEVMAEPVRIYGLIPNLFCLLGVILAVMLLDPAQEFLSLFGAHTGVHPPMFLREIVQLLMVFLSFAFGSNAIRRDNDFNFGAIIEVAALFFGIFICMQAPLQILNAKGADVVSKIDRYGSRINLDEAQEFFWISGALSSVLDNAPTYVVFFETAKAASEGELLEALQKNDEETAQKIEAELKEGSGQSGVAIPLKLLIAISLGSVFMGAMTYIGNGPNFMVKAIAEQSGVKMPSFFGYMGYSVCFLLPILIVMTLVFL